MKKYVCPVELPSEPKGLGGVSWSGMMQVCCRADVLLAPQAELYKVVRVVLVELK